MIEIIVNISGRRITNIQDIKNAFQQCKDGKHLMIIKDYRKRSLPQNSYYWGVCVPIIRQGLYDAGYEDVRTDLEAHEVIKQVHLKKRIVSKQTGDVIDISKSTTSLSIPDFNDFIERIVQWAAEYLSVRIPSPNEPMVVLNEYNEQLHETIVEE